MGPTTFFYTENFAGHVENQGDGSDYRMNAPKGSVKRKEQET